MKKRKRKRVDVSSDQLCNQHHAQFRECVQRNARRIRQVWDEYEAEFRSGDAALMIKEEIVMGSASGPHVVGVEILAMSREVILQTARVVEISEEAIKDLRVDRTGRKPLLILLGQKAGICGGIGGFVLNRIAAPTDMWNGEVE